MPAIIIAAQRTAVVPKGGAFNRLSLEDLAAPVLRSCLANAGMDADRVDEVIVSNALGAGGNPARRVALAAGLPQRVAGLTLDRQCSGGLDALLIAAALVNSGSADVVLAGGVESASRRPMRLRTDPDGGLPVAYDQAPFTPWPDRDPDMTEAAARLALRLGFSRADQDAWAVESHRKAMTAAPTDEIVPLAGQTADPFRRNLTLQLAARARAISGSVTAANMAVSADAAAFCLVVAPHLAKGAPRALRILGGQTLGGDPAEPGLAPVGAMAAVLDRANLTARGMVAEVMEAYAAQAMACVAASGLDPALVNRGGGALARGHPIGASGAVLAVRLFCDLQGGHGLAAIAAAGGIGTAILFGSGA